MPDLEAKARSEELGFLPVGESDYPPGTLQKSLTALGRLDGLAALRYTIGKVAQATRMLLRDAAEPMRRASIDALLVDQTEPAGGTLAERLGIPFVTVCNALMLNRESTVPPAFSNWSYGASLFHRLRNEAGYALSDRALKPVMLELNRGRRAWGLGPLRLHETYSPLAQISQQPPAFDYPRRELPPTFHYAGPLRRPAAQVPDFPWDRLDGRPLVYASLGTLQNGKESVFRKFAEACLGLNVQLVITHGGGLSEQAAGSFPGNPLVVSYAPQLEILQRARLTLTHAGLNTMLDALSCGVPLVAVPIAYEQPAIAKRMEWCGAGKAVPFRGLKTESIRRAVEEVLGDNSYRENAGRVQRSIVAAGGVRQAADIIEKVLH